MSDDSDVDVDDLLFDCKTRLKKLHGISEHTPYILIGNLAFTGVRADILEWLDVLSPYRTNMALIAQGSIPPPEPEFPEKLGTKKAKERAIHYVVAMQEWAEKIKAAQSPAAHPAAVAATAAKPVEQPTIFYHVELTYSYCGQQVSVSQQEHNVLQLFLGLGVDCLNYPRIGNVVSNPKVVIDSLRSKFPDAVFKNPGKGKGYTVRVRLATK